MPSPIPTKANRHRLVFYSVLFVLAGLSALAPILANDKPIRLTATFPAEVSRFARLLPISSRSLEQLVESDSRDQEALFLLRASEALVQFTEGQESLIAEFDVALDRALSEPDPQHFLELRNSAQSIRDRCLDESGTILCTLREKTYWPALEELSWINALLIGILSVLGLGLILRWMGASPHRSIGFLTACISIPWLTYLTVILLTSDKSPPHIEATFISRGDVHVSHALWPPIPFHPQNTDDQNISSHPTSRRANGTDEAQSHLPLRIHFAGTDGSGRDILALLLWGGRASLLIGLAATGLVLLIGLTIGGTAGLYGHRVDRALSQFIVGVQCVPGLIAAMMVCAFMERGFGTLILIIGLVRWPTIARLVRGEFMRLSQETFIRAGYALGAKRSRVFIRHLFPNALGPILVAGTFGAADGILIESTLSFLGLGLGEASPSWGSILAEARTAPKSWWLSIFPGMMIFLSILSFNAIGESLKLSSSSMKTR